MMPVLILPSLGPPPTVRFVGVEFEYGGERGWRVMGNNYRSGIRPATDFLFFSLGRREEGLSMSKSKYNMLENYH